MTAHQNPNQLGPAEVWGPVPTVPAGLEPLVDLIRLRLNPASIWLSDGASHGTARDSGDWDVVVALPDDSDPNLLDPILGWLIQNEAGVPANILATTSSALAQSWGKPSGIGHDLVRHGRRIA